MKRLLGLMILMLLVSSCQRPQVPPKVDANLPDMDAFDSRVTIYQVLKPEQDTGVIDIQVEVDTTMKDRTKTYTELYTQNILPNSIPDQDHAISRNFGTWQGDERFTMNADNHSLAESLVFSYKIKDLAEFKKLVTEPFTVIVAWADGKDVNVIPPEDIQYATKNAQ